MMFRLALAIFSALVLARLRRDVDSRLAELNALTDLSQPAEPDADWLHPDTRARWDAFLATPEAQRWALRALEIQRSAARGQYLEDIGRSSVGPLSRHVPYDVDGDDEQWVTAIDVWIGAEDSLGREVGYGASLADWPNAEERAELARQAQADLAAAAAAVGLATGASYADPQHLEDLNLRSHAATA